MTSLHLSDAQAQDLADGLLPPGESERLQRHLAGCPACRAAVDGYARLARALGDLDVPVLPAGFTEGVLARIDAHERTAARERRLAAVILAGAVAAAAAAFAFAGESAWAPAVSSAAGDLAWTVRLARAGAAFVPAVAGPLRPQIVLASALLALPLLLALSRLVPRPRTEGV